MSWNYLYFSVIGVLFVVYVFRKVKRNEFSEERSIFWIVGGVIMLCLSLFPVIFIKLSSFLGIFYPPSLLFLLSIVFVVFVTFRQDQEISQLSERVNELAQRNALLEQAVSTFNAEERLNMDNDGEEGKQATSINRTKNHLVVDFQPPNG